MAQTKKQSLFESVVNVAVGFGVALLIQIIVFPLFGIIASFGENLAISAIFTIVSILRGYILRRFFVWYHGG
jgi:hypothetical protein